MQATVLLAEDSKTVRRMVEIALDREPYTVQLAEDGNTALSMVRRVRPAVLLVDSHLPGIDGYELARRVKSDPETRDVKIFVLAGQNQPYDASRGYSAGIDGHLVKPFITQELIDTVNRATGKKVTGRNIFATGVLNIPLARKPEPAPQDRAPTPPRPPSRPAPMNAPARPPAPPPAPPPAAPRSTGAGRGPTIGPGADAMPPPPPPSFNAPRVPPPAPMPAADEEGPPPGFGDMPTVANVERPPNRASVEEAVAGAVSAAIADRPVLEKAITGASKEIIERVIWEIVPPLAEAILKEEIARVVRERMTVQ